MTSPTTRERRLVGAAALTTVVFFALLLPGTLALDGHADRARPLYDDVLAAAQYEWAQIQDTGRPVPLTLGAGSEDAGPGGIELDDDTEHLQVTVAGTGYCIEARNTFGDETGELCFEGRKEPKTIFDDRT